jgi:hypothetical protein
MRTSGTKEPGSDMLIPGGRGIRRLMAASRGFQAAHRTGVCPDVRNLRHRALPAGRWSFPGISGSSDSRVPAEISLDGTSCQPLTVMVFAYVVGQSQLSSLATAFASIGTYVVLSMGQIGCRAVFGALARRPRSGSGVHWGNLEAMTSRLPRVFCRWEWAEPRSNPPRAETKGAERVHAKAVTDQEALQSDLLAHSTWSPHLRTVGLTHDMKARPVEHTEDAPLPAAGELGASRFPFAAGSLIGTGAEP